MKLRNFLLCISAAAALFAGCKEDEHLTGEPRLTLNPSELAFGETAASQTMTLSSTREWKVNGTLPEWVDINPVSGGAAPDGISIEVTVTDNAGTDRNASIEFTIGTIKKNLEISQKGEGGSADALVIYHNDFDKEKADKGDSWGSQTLDVNQTWRNETGSGISALDYSFSGMTVRNGSGLANSSNDGNASSLYAGSGVNNLFFAKENYFQVKNIALDASKKNYVLSFGSIRSVFSAAAGESIFDANQFSVYISNDGAKWVKLNYTFASGAAPDAKWDKLSSVFTLPDNTSKLYLYFTTTEASTYRIDDLDLSISSVAGTAIDFSKGVGLSGGSAGGGDVVGTPEGNGTEASPYNVAAALTATKALAADTPTDNDIYVKGTISEIKEIDTGTYGNATYSISDDGTTAGQFTVYRGYYLNGDKFTSADQIKVGDKVVVCGKLVNYKGNTPEVNSGNKIVSLNGSSSDDTKRLSVSTTSINVVAEAMSATFNVNGNVTWTASVTEGSDFVKILSGANGNGAGAVVLELTQNTSTEAARTAKVTVSTTEDAATKSYVVTVTQAKKAGEPSGDAFTIVLDASERPCDSFPNTSAGETTAKTYTIGGYDWTFSPSSGNKFSWYTDGYILWGKQDGYILMPSVAGKKLTKVTILTGKGASVSVMVGVYNEAGTAAVTGGEAIKLGEQNAEFSWNLTGSENNAKYQLRVTSKHNAQLQKLTLIYE